MAIAAGLWVGGQKPVIMIQNPGFFESDDSVRSLALDVNLPLVMMVGYKGWTRQGGSLDSAARFTEPILHTWGIDYYLVETNADAERLSIAFNETQQFSVPGPV